MYFKKHAIAAIVVGTLASLPTLAQEQEQMEVMVITASMTEKTTVTAPAFTTVITADEIASSTVTGLPELIGKTAGVNNLTDSTGRDELQLRGLSGGYTLVLINGKRVSSHGALWRGGDFDLSSIPLSSIKQVEIVRGPMSSLYGADAIGGVINIITKSPTADWEGTVNGESQVINTGDGGSQLRIGIAAQGPLNDQLHLAISAEIYDREAWYSEGDDAGSASPKFEEKQAKNLSTTLRWQLDQQQSLDFDLGYNNDKRPYNIYWSNGTYTDYRDQDIDRTTLGLTHGGEWSWGNTTLQFQHEDSDIYDFNSRYDAPTERRVSETNTSIKGVANFMIGDINAMTIGFDHRQQVIDDNVSYAATGEVSITDTAVFAQDELSLSDNLTLTLGARLDDNEFFGNEFTPRAYLVYQLNDVLTLKGGVGKAFKAPQAYQLSDEYSIISCGGGCFLSGDPSLTPEMSVNYELGIVLSQDAWKLSAVYYKNDVEDMITALYDAVANQRYWANVDQVQISGIEIDGRFDFTDEISITGNVSKLDIETSSDSELENRPEQASNISLNGNFSDLINVSLTFTHTGKQKTYVWPEYTDLPSYNRVDLGFVSYIGNDIKLRYGVKNLTDTQTQEKDENFSTYELGRSLYIGASYDF